MSFSLNRIGQISIAVADLDRAETFYEVTLGLRKLYRYGEDGMLPPDPLEVAWSWPKQTT